MNTDLLTSNVVSTDLIRVIRAGVSQNATPAQIQAGLVSGGSSTASVLRAKGTVNIGDAIPSGARPLTNVLNVASATGLDGPAVDARLQVNFTTPLLSNGYIILGNLTSVVAGNWNNDNEISWNVVSKSTTGFVISTRELSSAVQNLDFNFEIREEATISGQTLIAGTGITIIGGVVSTSVPIHALVRQTVVQALVAIIPATLNLNTIVSSSAGITAATGVAQHITINTAGLYHISMKVTFDATTLGAYRKAYVGLNGTAEGVIKMQAIKPPNTLGNIVSCEYSSIRSLIVGDTLRLVAQTASICNTSVGNDCSELAVYKIG